MNFNFDLISDIHRETWPNFDWTGQPTSQYCIVAGDIARDRALVVDTLAHLSSVYTGVFYIDGNDEHKDHVENLNRSYAELNDLITPMNNVVYMQDNVVVMNGVAILATNGWWSYDFDPKLELDQSLEWSRAKDNISRHAAININGTAYRDAGYLVNSVAKLQTYQDVKSIIIVTHTVPTPKIIEHDLELIDTWRFNSMGNSYVNAAIESDTENKIKLWCFGHYHRPVDTMIDGIRYVSNPLGRGDTEYSQTVYYPKRISIKI
jgi:UDP-2,3-diacylglucosamine pyrophosphatase LpxH